MHNWDDMRFFLAVARAGSFSEAAQQLGVTHSTVSRRIAALEQRHGVRLLERHQHGCEVTAAGAAVIESLEAMEVAGMRASRVLMGRDTRLEGPLNLTMPHDIFDHLLAEPLAGFARDYPGIELSLHVGKGLRNLANREADMAVRITPAPPEYLVGRRVCRIQHGFYARRDRLPELTGAQQTPVVLWTDGKALPDWAPAHFPRPRVALRVDDLLSMYRAVAAGYGIARMPCFLPDALGDPQVVRLPLAQPPSDWGVWVLHHVDLRQTARIQRLRTFLIDELEQRRALFRGERSLTVGETSG